jgi:hypothetical protein
MWEELYVTDVRTVLSALTTLTWLVRKWNYIYACAVKLDDILKVKPVSVLRRTAHWLGVWSDHFTGMDPTWSPHGSESSGEISSFNI